MSYYVGRRGNLGVAKETVRGTAVTPTYWVPYNSLSFDKKAIVVDQEASFGNVADTMSAHITKKYGEGSFEADLEDKIIGLILSNVLGAVPSSSGSTNYTHTYTFQNTNQPQSLSLFVQDPNGQTIFPLSMIDKFEIKVEPEGIVKYSVDFRSKAGQDWTAQTANYTALGNKFLHQHLAFKLADTIGNLEAASVLSLRSLTFTVSKNLKDFDDMGTVTPGDILNQSVSVEGSIELGYSDRVYRNYMLDGTYRAMDITLTYGTNNSLQFQLPRVSFRNWEPNKGLDDIVTEKIDFKGHYDSVNALQIISTCVLKNQVSVY